MIWELFKKDLVRLTKQPTGFLILIALPLLLATFMGMVFGTNNDDAMLPTIKLIIEDHDDSFVSSMAKSAFSQGELAKMFDVQHVDKDAGRVFIEEDKAAALLIIPQGFADSLFAMTKTELILVKNPSLAFGPKITEEVVQILAEAGDRLVHIGEEPIGMIRNETDNEDQMTDETMAAVAVMMNQMINKTGDLIFNPPISLKKQSVSEEAETTSDQKIIFAILLTGIATMCLYFILNGLAVDFFREREQFTLYRILVSPARALHYVLAKQLYLFSAGLISMGAVWLLAFTLLGVPLKLAQFVPFLVMLLLITASGTGVVSLLYTIVRTRGQSAAIVPVVIIFFSLLGGGMLPLQSMPNFFKSMSFFSPVFWGVDGLQKILIDNAGFSGIIRHAAVLVGLSTVTLVAALFFQQRRVER